MPNDKPRIILLPILCNGCLHSADGKAIAFWERDVTYYPYLVLGDGIVQCPVCQTIYDTVGQSPPEPGEPVPDQYLLNPTFAEPYHAQDNQGPLQVADKWRAEWAGSYRPEWRKATGPEVSPNWENAQQWFSTSNKMDAWVFQRVNVGAENKGKYARLVVTCALESKNVGSGEGEYWASVGIDRWGNADIRGKTISWSTPRIQQAVPRWTTIEVLAPIENDAVTVFVQVMNKYPASGSIFVKSAYLYVVDDPCPSVPVEPPAEPPVAGECKFDDSAIMLAVANVSEQLDQVLAKLGESGSPDVQVILDKLDNLTMKAVSTG